MNLTYNNYPQINIISKTYTPFSLTKFQLIIRDENADAVELVEIYEDAIDIIEGNINKAVSYTLQEYIFRNISFKTLLVDEGHFNSISAITITDINNNTSIVTDYTIWHDSNNFRITFTNSISNAKEVKVLFYSGFINDYLPKSIRRVLYIVVADLYDSERSSYTMGTSKKSDIIERYLKPFRKSYFHDYNKHSNYYNNFNYNNIIY